MLDINFKEYERQRNHEAARKSVARHLAVIYKSEMKRIAYELVNVRKNPFTTACADYFNLMDKIEKENDAEFTADIKDIFWDYYSSEWEASRCLTA